MKLIGTLLLLLPLLCFSETEIDTTIKVISNQFDANIPKGKTRLEINFYAPNGDKASGNSIIVIIGKDTICNENNSISNFKRFVDAGDQFIKISGKYWYTTSRNIKFQSQHRMVLEVHFDARPMEIPGIEYNYDKPVIYVYPEKEQEVEIELSLKGELGFTYPEYKNSWKFTASPEGKLKVENKVYNYLFWDGKVNAENVNTDMSEGFIINDRDLPGFFETTLTKMGLSASEQQDFITYWVPLMKTHARNYIHFVYNDEYNQIANLKVTPNPDSRIRLFMFWKELPSNYNLVIKEQQIPEFKREGFTLVEWGGSEIPQEINLTEK